MKYSLADKLNGAFGETYESLELAELALNEEIKYWQGEDAKLSDDELGVLSLEQKQAETADFLCVVKLDSHV
jgi:hypothetical protein